MPPKGSTSSVPRRRSMRIQNIEEDKKRTNLKDLLKRGSSSLEQKKKAAEKDGGFSFPGTSSKSKANGSVSSSSTTAKSRATGPAAKKGKMRRLQAEDMMITPDKQNQKKRQKKNPSTSTSTSTPTATATKRKRVNDDYEEHSTSMQIALPISDTPIIRRNKEYRNNGSQGRRSSLSNRGKRVSSIGNGFSGVPHEQVPTSEYYKHLDHSLPDPHKMRQLLTWCAKRVFDEDKNRHIKQKNKLPAEELTALNIAKVIKEEIVNDLTNGKINISWWNRDDEDDEATGESSQNVEKTLSPNERNVKNAEALDQLKSRLLELKESCSEWEKDMSKHVELPTISMANVKLDPGSSELMKKVLDKSLLNEISKVEHSAFHEISENLEITMDSFTELTHHLKSSSVGRQKFVSDKSQVLSNILDTTFDDDTLSKMSKSEVNRDIDTQDLLRGISRLDR
ncbi:CYFA0S02e03444g1_1 [Cyberlindnera fabianii]|uniref:CYFA0S02e03444g1_1 n=1 Tax=Cyberlindnera fabianii TaxID=36022 RepID=A0A061AV34_CYBFA|nr:Kinetochore protein mis13 [Cyberlindnera fabianii]CDR38590.1 CYFA0S02e03444g1_1 [Cyberlindnera fabianii]